MRRICFTIGIVILAGGAPALAQPLSHAAGHDQFHIGRTAQLPRYSAAGSHQCNSGGSCVVTGLFSDCNEAASSLRTRDCCASAKGGGKSSSFSMTYCIRDIAR